MACDGGCERGGGEGKEGLLVNKGREGDGGLKGRVRSGGQDLGCTRSKSCHYNGQTWK